MQESLQKVREFHAALGAKIAEQPALLECDTAKAREIGTEVRDLSRRCGELSPACGLLFSRLAMDLEELAEWVEAHADGDLVAAADAWGIGNTCSLATPWGWPACSGNLRRGTSLQHDQGQDARRQSGQGSEGEFVPEADTRPSVGDLAFVIVNPTNPGELRMTESEDAKIRSWIAFACERCGCPELAAKITYSFNNSMRIRGRAFPCSNRIEFNPKLWAKLSLQEKRNLVVHEACHLTARLLYGDWLTSEYKGHGVGWRECMRKCGMPLEEYRRYGRREKLPEPPREPSLLVSAMCGCSSKKKIDIWLAEDIRLGKEERCLVCRHPLRLTYPRQTSFISPLPRSRTQRDDEPTTCSEEANTEG